MNRCERILPSILPAVPRIIAIGDIHGDYRALKKCLKLAKVMNSSKQWIGGNTIVVQLGDQVDSKCRGLNCEKDEIGDELKILKFVDKLHEEAKKQGGAVYSLLGNHELMNTMGNMNYASAENILTFGSKKERMSRFAPRGEMAIYLACNRNSIMKIGDFLFVHGGLMPQYAQKYPLEKLNEIIREYLLGNKSINDTDVNELLTDKKGPFWDRTFSRMKKDNSQKCSLLKETLKIIQVKGMIVGHTVQKEGISSACNGEIWRTDIGLSRSFGGENRIQVLEIINNGAKINILQ